MDKPLRILHLEDDPDYCDLVRAMFEKDGLRVEMVLVDNSADFIAALEKEAFDVILADYALPTCNALQVLPVARQKRPDTPFLLVSGTIGEQAAIESLKCGATDYVLKHTPERLVPSVRRAVQEARERTQRKQAETELIRREKYFRALTENSLDVLSILNRDGVFQYNSPSVKRVLGYEPQELAGHNAAKLVHPEDLPGALQAFEQGLKNPELRITHEFRCRRQNGTWCHLEVVGQNRLDDPEINGIVVNSRDVTDRKELESELRQAQKMEAIGQLAGGVAHDFNNILMVIHGHASLLLAGKSLSDPAAKSVQQIAQSAERAAKLTQQLLAFSRRQVMQPQPLDMSEVVSNMTKMLGRILGEDIVLQLDYGRQLPSVRADAGMLEQVLLNLVVNSRDAMPKGGQLSIKMSVAEIDARHVERHPEARAGKFVCLGVNDNGCGIAPGNLQRIFEPFFTTKEVGKGTGLGLAMVYGIVKQHRGWIEVESKLGKGTAFRIYLPASTESAHPREGGAMERAVRGGTETILVVEDEAPVRELECDFLAGYGYKVLHAESGVKALAVWQQNKDKIDLLLADLIMPDCLNGHELAEKLWEEKPKLKVIFTSGYSEDVAGKDFVLRHGSRYLQKPYDLMKLALAVRDCLDA